MYKDDLEFNDPSKHVDAFLSGADLSCFNQEARKRKKLEKQRSIPKSPADIFQPAYVVIKRFKYQNLNHSKGI